MSLPSETGSITEHKLSILKILLIGDTSVGKSSLLVRFVDETFLPDYVATVGIDFKIRTLEVDGRLVKLQIWDTAGQERVRTFTTSYYRGAMGIFVVFDVANRRSFDNTDYWVNNVREHANPNVAIMLIGNKCDLNPSLREVSTEEAQAKAEEKGVPFIETSALQGVNVETMFRELSANILQKMPQNAQSLGHGAGDTISFDEPSGPQVDSKKKCC